MSEGRNCKRWLGCKQHYSLKIQEKKSHILQPFLCYVFYFFLIFKIVFLFLIFCSGLFSILIYFPSKLKWVCRGWFILLVTRILFKEKCSSVFPFFKDDLGKLVADVSELLPDCIFHRSVKPGSFMTYGKEWPWVFLIDEVTFPFIKIMLTRLHIFKPVDFASVIRSDVQGTIKTVILNCVDTNLW